jgi:glycosyltransferase involved in cell wall biosynthesis
MTSNTKIIVFAPYYHPHIGGVESYARELNVQLAQRNFKLTVFTPHLPKNTPAVEEIDGIEILRFPAFEIIHNYPLPKFWSPTFWKLFLSLGGNSFELVISHTRFFNTSLLALIFAKTKKINWIHVEHGSSFVQTNNPILSFASKTYDLIFGKLILSQTDHIIAISEAVKNFIEKLGIKEKCTVIYRGFDINEIEKIKANDELRKKYSEDVIILFIGRLISGKGVSDLLNAISGIKNNNIKCFIIGDGPEKESLTNLAKKLKIENDIVFFGRKTFSETISILKIADIFVNPSHSEGLPTTVIEAALCQKAIIATNVGGTNEIIINNESGLIIESKNIKQLQVSLEKLITNTNFAKEISQNALNENINKFKWDKCVTELIKIIEKVKA